MKKKTAGRSALQSRVVRTLGLTRAAKLNFPGIFMDVQGHQVGEDGMVLSVKDDPSLRDGHGELSPVAFGVLIDIVLGAVTRLRSGENMRPATVRLDVQMTGAPMVGDVSTEAKFVGYSEDTRVTHATTSGTVIADGQIAAHCTGAFVIFDLPPGQKQTIQPWLAEEYGEMTFDEIELEDAERDAVAACRRAEKAATDEHPFVEHFWCGVPTVKDGKAELRFKVTPHLGNRVGQVHGGVLFGAAMVTANAAAPAGMRLSNVCAWFISPGLPPRLRVRSEPIQQGKTLTVIRTQIRNAEGKLVLECMSQYVAGAEAEQALS